MALLTRLRSTRSSSTGSACATRLLAAKAEHQALFEGRGLEVQAQPRKQLAQAHRRRVDVHAAGVDAGDVQQFAEQAFQRVDRFVDAVHQRRHLGVVAALAQASANRPMACSGWRRSWLAAAKNCVLARLAASAARRPSSATAISRRRRDGQFVGAALARDGLAQRAAVGARHQHGDAEHQRQDHRHLQVPGLAGVAGHAHDGGREHQAEEDQEDAGCDASNCTEPGSRCRR
jgi:hypothetical protein